MGLLQTASFRGVPFKVVSAQVKKGRRWAIHEYPYVDGGWPEDMGRALRTFSFSGYLIGDLAPVMQNLLDVAIETEGPGLLIHPTIGALKVGLVSSSTAVHRDKMRVIEVALEFVEAGDSLFPLAIVATVVSVLAAADSALTATNNDLAGSAGPAAAVGPAVTGEGANVVGAFAAQTATGGANPTAIVGMAAALPPPDSNTSYGRYGAGSASTLLPDGTTVASLQAQLANQRAALAMAASGASAAAAAYSASTDMMDALAALVEAMRAGITDPANQVRVLLGLAGFNYADSAGGSVGVGAAMATIRNAMAAACRRAALISLARASASYQPRSSQDAAGLRESLAAALDAEITIAGDAGEDQSYGALKALRSAVVRDLTVRGANLPSVVSVSLALALPALAVAQMLYTDASRSDEIIAESGAVHPAFIPVSFRALNSGMGPNVTMTLPLLSQDGPTRPLIAPAQPGGVYHLPPPAGPTGLDILTATNSTIGLSWSAPATGGTPSSYIVQVSPTGIGAWTTGATVSGSSTSGLVSGLTASTAYDFQVIAVNVDGQSPPSALATGTTMVNPPNVPAGVAVSAGSPSSSAALLSWTASAVDTYHGAAASYQPQYLPYGGAWTNLGSPIAGTSATITGLTPGTAFTFQVVAINASGTAASATVGLSTTSPAPNAPTGLTASAGSPAYSVVALSWTAPAVDGTHGAAATYQPQYELASGGSWTNFGSPITGTSVNVTGLAHATAFNFQVIAINSGGSATSSSTGATTGTAAPNAAASLTASAGSPAYSAVNLTWTAPATDGTHDAATSYAVSYGTDGVTWTAASGAWTSGTTAVVTVLAFSTAYYFQIVASNVGGTGGTVATESTITTGVAPPNAPSAPTVVPVNDGTTTKLAVTWTAPATDSTHAAATGYNVQYQAVGAGSWTAGPSGSGTSGTLTGLTAGTSYNVQVQATNASAESPSAWSASTTKSTYSRTVAWGISGAPGSTFTHGSGNINGVSNAGMNAVISPNPSSGVYFAATTSNTIVPTAAQGVSQSYYGTTYNWAGYYAVPATAGTYYFWAYDSDGSCALVSAAITVT